MTGTELRAAMSERVGYEFGEIDLGDGITVAKPIAEMTSLGMVEVYAPFDGPARACVHTIGDHYAPNLVHVLELLEPSAKDWVLTRLREISYSRSSPEVWETRDCPHGRITITHLAGLPSTAVQLGDDGPCYWRQ